MSNQTESRRVEIKASHTALMAAIYRFLATKEKSHTFSGPDFMAKMFLPSKAKFFLSAGFFRKLFKKKLGERGPGSYEYITARTKYFDDIFIKALKGYTPQIVILGAGYDTRSQRFEELIKNTKVFELDIATTQMKKIRLLNKNKSSIPENLTFVSINFDKDNMKDKLLNAGYDLNKQTLFLWEGVTMYITEDSVKETLDFVKNNSGQGSTIAFDYLYASVIRNDCSYYGAKELAAIVKEKGESFTFGIEEGKIEEFLFQSGFTAIDHYTPSQFEEKYLFDDTGEFFGNMYGFACHVLAKN